MSIRGDFDQSCYDYSAKIIITGTGEILNEKPWQRHKQNAMILVNMYERALELDPTCISPSRIDALRGCASYLFFDIDAVKQKKLRRANFCRLRTCPMCNWRKSLKLFGQMSRIVDLILQDRPSTCFVFVTLTVKNCEADNLSETLNQMNQAFRYLTSKRQTFAPAEKLKKSLLGYMKAVEVTYNIAKNTYHPHIHCIFAVQASYFSRDYISQDEWVDLWQKCAGLDYRPSVNVKAIKNAQSKKAVAELAKYPVKMDEIAEIGDRAVPALITFSHALKNRRLITFGGVIADAKKQLMLDDIETGDLVHVGTSTEFNAVATVMYTWRVKAGAYIC